MTADELRELDARVHREVMGGKIVLTAESKTIAGTRHYWAQFYPVPPYSSDIAAAWMVVEKMRADDWLVSVKSQPDCGAFIVEGARSEYDAPSPARQIGKGKVVCELQDMRTEGKYRHSQWAFADTAPLAICLAALKAVEALA